MARKWKTYVDPVTKEKRKLIDFWWQKAGAQRILQSLENCTESLGGEEGRGGVKTLGG